MDRGHHGLDWDHVVIVDTFRDLTMHTLRPGDPGLKDQMFSHPFGKSSVYDNDANQMMLEVFRAKVSSSDRCLIIRIRLNPDYSQAKRNDSDSAQASSDQKQP